MSEPRRIRSVPIGVGAEGPTWADGWILADVEDGERGPGSPYPYPWAVEVEWTIEDGKATATGMQLLAMHGQPMTATAWRSIPVAQVIERARRHTAKLHDILATLHEDHHVPGPEGAEHQQSAHALSPEAPRRRGRPFAMSDQHYRRLAEIYNAAVNGGDPKPVKAVAEALGCLPGDTRPKAWIREARRRGLIPQSTVRTTEQG